MLVDPALIVVDMQNDFCNSEITDLAEMADHAESAVRSTEQFLERYRATDRTPIFIRTVRDEFATYPTWEEAFRTRDRPIPCVPGTEGIEFHPALTVLDTDIIVKKHQYSAFYGTNLEVYLQSNDISHLIVCGVNTNICVQSTVFDAFNRGYFVTVLSDCTTTRYEERLHEAFLENLGSREFCDVVSSDEVELTHATPTSQAD